jgi:hypothetical protein
MRHSNGVIANDTLGMKTNNILTSVFVVKIRKRSQRVNTFLKVDGRERRTEVVPATDLLMQTPLFYEG